MKETNVFNVLFFHLFPMGLKELPSIKLHLELHKQFFSMLLL